MFVIVYSNFHAVDTLQYNYNMEELHYIIQGIPEKQLFADLKKNQ